MIKTSIILLLALCSSLGFAQRVPSSCTAPDSVLALYRQDAAKMALYYQIKRDSSYIDSATISQSLQDTFLRALVAVHNCGLQATDTMLGKVYLYNPANQLDGTITAHFSQGGSLQKIALTLDTSISWERNIALGIIPSGNSQIDSLMQVFEMKLDSFYLTQDIFTYLTTKHYYNVKIIADQWNKFAGSKRAYVNRYISDGGNIKPFFTDSSITLEYQYLWGDCPSGCIWGHAWVFTVFSDCSVQYDSSIGAFQLFRSVHSVNSKESRLLFYPDPVSKTITVESKNLLTLDIITHDGITLKHIRCLGDKQDVPVSELSQGTYLIRATDRDGNISVGKFIKN